MRTRSVGDHTSSRNTSPPPPSTLRREIVLTHLAICITLMTAVVSLSGLTRSIVEHMGAHRWGSGLGQALFVGIVGVLIYGGLVYQLARLGHLRRLLAHRPASEAELHRFFHSSPVPAVTILVPSYKEDPQVIRRTLLSAALQDYPNRRLVLLIDDPVDPAHPSDAALLAAARALPDEIQEYLRKPAALVADAQDVLLVRMASGPIDHHDESRRLAQLYRDAAAWFEEQAVGYPLADHADALFVELTFRAPARQCREQADQWAQQGSRSARGGAQELVDAYQRLAARFRIDVSSFERKQFANLSHAPNKAMNLNSYIALMGRHWRIRPAVDGRLLEPARPEDADLSIPEAEHVLMVDADSVIAPDYTLRLSHLLAQPGHERTAVVQTPYSAFPDAPGVLERIAGATTDIQYLIHQGFTAFGATFWVGANALARKTALEDIAELDEERGYPVRRFIQDRTVIEDTESTVDLITHGWRLHNYPERLAFSATPPDFGALLIQRRRWANGGLLILPKLCRYLAGRPTVRAAIREGFMRSHYLASLAMVNIGLLLMLTLSFDDGLRTLWLPLTAIPYYALYARDLRGAGYRVADVFRVFALNLLLIPVNLGGVMSSLRQASTGEKSPFGRTPKIQGRTAVPPRYLIATYALLVHWALGAVFEFIHGRPLHAVFALVNAAFLAYAIDRFIGLRETWADLMTRVTGAGLRPGRRLITRLRVLLPLRQRSPYAP
jgi:cellulose synthase/poly-beta-1,6-N-acetylglucosamine synthase-like glycosyltransferase